LPVLGGRDIRSARIILPRHLLNGISTGIEYRLRLEALPCMRDGQLWPANYRKVTLFLILRNQAERGSSQAHHSAHQSVAIPAGQLTIHADRGRVMKSKPVAFLMADLGVTKSHSRPYVSDDNPYSESQFRTMKYRPDFPDRFGCIQDSRAFCQQFFQWYNEEHHHSGIALLTPAVVHFGETQAVLAHRQVVLDTAYQIHPDRFVRRPPKPMPLPTEVWINKPMPSAQKTKEDRQ